MKTLTVKVLGTNKQITIKDVYTRGVDRMFTKLLFKDATTTTNANGKIDFSINPTNMAEANDYLVNSMASLTQEEIDSLSTKEFDSIMKEILKVKNPEEDKKTPSESK